jgi:endonuclease III
MLLELPEPKKLVTTLLTQNIPKIEGRISEWLQNEMNELKMSRTWSKDKIFMLYVSSLLARQSYEGWWDKVNNWLINDIKRIDNLPSENDISKRLTEFGYRFPPQGGKVITQVKEIFNEKFNNDWNQYFMIADKNYKNDFPNDPFLKIKNIGFKVRDLALSNFSPKYIAIDEHVVEVIKRTGLICYAYPFRLELTTNQSDDYLQLRELCVNISELAGIEPRELDRLLWLHGKYICSGRNKKCRNCVINNMCLTYLNEGCHAV